MDSGKAPAAFFLLADFGSACRGRGLKLLGRGCGFQLSDQRVQFTGNARGWAGGERPQLALDLPQLGGHIE